MTSILKNISTRVPLIHFTHGKRTPPSSLPSSSTTTATIKSGSIRIDFLDLPPMFGRLPPMTDKMIQYANQGGVYDEPPPAVTGVDKNKNKKSR